MIAWKRVFWSVIVISVFSYISYKYPIILYLVISFIVLMGIILGWEITKKLLKYFILSYLEKTEMKTNLHYNNDNKIENNFPTNYVMKIPKENYDKVTDIYTQIELNKLYSNKKFKKMLKEKGTSKKNWVWQTDQKYQTYSPSFKINKYDTKEYNLDSEEEEDL